MMCTTSNSARCAPIAGVIMEPNMPSHLGPKRWGGGRTTTWTGTQIIWWVLGRLLRVCSMNQCCAALWIFKELLVLVL
jgi:hypothetical protein